MGLILGTVERNEKERRVAKTLWNATERWNGGSIAYIYRLLSSEVSMWNVFVVSILCEASN